MSGDNAMTDPLASPDVTARKTPVSDAVLEAAERALVDASQWNEGEPCWCPLWWWEEQTGPSEGVHSEHCDQQRVLFTEVEEALHGRP